MRLVLFGISALALLLVAAVIGPSFVDWNKYKPQIVSQVKNATGLDVAVNGDLSLGILPAPHVKIEGMVVNAPLKKQFDTLLSMKSAEVSVELIPLFSKEIKVSSVSLIEPVIQVEIMADGTPSWQTEKLAQANEAPEAAPQESEQAPQPAGNKAMDSISLDRLEIENGQLTYVDHQKNITHSVKDINIDLKANSLKGPFALKGDLVYQDKKIVVDLDTSKLPTGDEGLTIQALIELPEMESSLKFSGVSAIKAPFDVQGQTTLSVKSPAQLAQGFGATLSPAMNKPLSFDGLLSANENRVQLDELKLSFGDFLGNGKLDVQNLKSKNPVTIGLNLKSSSVLNIDDFKSEKTASQKQNTSQENLKTAGTLKKKESGFVPQTLTLPMAINADVKLDLGGIKINGTTIKGVFADVQKSGKQTKVNFKALEIPGQAKTDGSLNIDYASSSAAAKTGQVTYSDPTVTYAVNGQVGQLADFLKAFAPDADTKAVTKLYKTAQFNLKGNVKANSVSLKDSTLKLDQMVIGLGGNYTPASAGKRAKAAIDLSAGTVDFDQIMGTTVKQAGASPDANQSAQPSASSSKANPKDALKPLQNFSLPLDLTFDLSVQKARLNGADIEGVRLTGDLVGQALNLKNASVNNYAGAAASVKGQVGNLSNLSGLDLAVYTKTSDFGRLASALKLDVSKMPKGLNALEVNLSGKGAIDALSFVANISALGGQVNATGNAADILGTPKFDDLTVRLKHPNLVSAIQVVKPDFDGPAGLRQAIDFYTKLNSAGKTYDLSDMKVTLGQSNFGGALKIDAGAKIPSVRGNISAGQIALDSLLGAKTAQKSSGASSASQSSGNAKSSASASSGRWSSAPIDLSFMNTVDVDVALSASSITYGAWNFTQPSTDLKIGNGQMVVNGMKAGVFGGQTTLSTTVKASPVSLSVKSDMSNIDLEKLAAALSGGSKLKTSGSVSFDMDVNATGGSANALVNALNGSANLNGKDVTLKGFDLVKLARGLATEEKLAVSAMSLIDGAMSGGQTRFDSLKGVYKIESGKVVIQSMALDSDEAIIETTGYADLPSWFINADNKITLKNVADLDPFMVKIKGPLDKPTNTFGKNILQDYIQDKLKRKINKELGDKLPGILGDDATNALQKFGILPTTQDTPKAVPAPTSDNNSEVTPEPVAPQPVQEAPKKIEKPEDAVKELLNSATPEDAVNNLIKGLF